MPMTQHITHGICILLLYGSSNEKWTSANMFYKLNIHSVYPEEELAGMRPHWKSDLKGLNILIWPRGHVVENLKRCNVKCTTVNLDKRKLTQNLSQCLYGFMHVKRHCDHGLWRTPFGWHPPALGRSSEKPQRCISVC